MDKPPRHVIRLRLDSIHQLFNSLDPSPFVGRDLDAAAEDFIMDWAQEDPAKGDFCLEIILSSPLSEGERVRVEREGRAASIGSVGTNA